MSQRDLLLDTTGEWTERLSDRDPTMGGRLPEPGPTRAEIMNARTIERMAEDYMSRATMPAGAWFDELRDCWVE